MKTQILELALTSRRSRRIRFQLLLALIVGFFTDQCANGHVTGFRWLQVDFGVLPGGGE